MKIIFFGTSQFAADILQFLAKTGRNIIAVVTQPDKPQGRNRKVSSPPVVQVKNFCLKDSQLLQPVKASDPEFLKKIESLEPDLIVVAAYGQILKQALLDIPLQGCINVHPSLLPKYRGANPIREALLHGDKKTGVSIIQMTKQMDAGDIYKQEKVDIPPDATFAELEKILLELSCRLLNEVIDLIEENKIVPFQQDHSLATYTRKVNEKDLLIDWNDPAEKVINQIRAFSPKPGAYTNICVHNKRKRIKILQAKMAKHSLSPGEIFIKDKSTFYVGSGKDSVEILQVQLEGKKICSTKEFLAGANRNISFVL